jgi:polyisoprenoid-binding protein YceI
MYRKIILLVATPLLLSAGSLSLTQGEIKTHTEVFGDSNINPSTKIITVEASIDDAIESLSGKFSIKTLDLKSKKEDRDEHMHEALEATKYPEIVVDIQNITKVENLYKLSGTVTLHGVTKPLTTIAEINKNKNDLSVNGSFFVNTTEHGMEPIKLLFLTVRERIDITYDLQLKGD